MPEKWLQIKGDPSIRSFLFQQSRVTSLFDENIDILHEIVYQLLTVKGAFHAKIHYSSNQLTCWFVDDAYRYRVFVKEEVFEPDFLSNFRDCEIKHLQPLINKSETELILNEFRRLRLTDETVYLRSGSMNLINGVIGMNFSCDGAHYIDHETFFQKLENFGTVDIENKCVD